MKTFKTRHQFYLPDDLSKRLEGLAAKPGSSKTTILTDALRSWLDRKAGDEFDQRFGPRLDRQMRASNRMEVRLDHVVAVLELFVAHQMTLVAHQPPIDEVTGRLGRARYDRFMGQVERTLAARGGKSQPGVGGDA
ncbi:ribbon-helix-helix domain-containing protein [Sphingomonas oligophenolica]|uniref:Ribbon-helix-helix domain-containing protein n=1 Tax=Sphingomonas oligophenolica TaxID=301154 RepID=A0ABU9Y3J1_9SPHN